MEEGAARRAGTAGVERARVGLVLDEATGGFVHEGDALGHDPGRARPERGRHQVGGAFAPDSVVGGELLTDLLGVDRLRQRRQLVDDRIRLRLAHDLTEGLGVEDIGDDGVGPDGPQGVEPVGPARHGRHVVPGLHQLGHQPAPDHSRGSRQEHPHDSSSRFR
jgi:hypothetical protein